MLHRLGVSMKSKIVSLLRDRLLEKRCLKIGFLGLGKTNRAILNMLDDEIPQAEVIIRSALDVDSAMYPRAVIRTGENEKSNIDEDFLFVSPSVRRETLNTFSNTVVTSDTEIYFSSPLPTSFLISGSDGKSTVTTMTSEILSPTFPKLFTGGNIGTPLALCNLSSTDAAVLELSSFNLRYIAPKSKRSVITNITPNHLNWHESYAEYVDAKANLIRHCEEPIINVDTTECESLAKSTRLFAACSYTRTHEELRSVFSTEHTISFNGGIYIDGALVLPIDNIKHKQRHNIENLMSAVAITLGYTDADTISKVASSFTPLCHRCEHFLSANGIDFINSSIDTSPQRTATTLTGIGKSVSLILGGSGKGLELSPLTSPLSKYARRIAIYGNMRSELYGFIKATPSLKHIPVSSFEHLYEAVEYMMTTLNEGDTLLLSPAATAYGEFGNFVERGNFFKEYIRNKYKK